MNMRVTIRTELLSPMEGKINLAALLNHVLPYKKNSSLAT